MCNCECCIFWQENLAQKEIGRSEVTYNAILEKLMVATKALEEGAEFYKTDDVNGQAGEICKQALAKIKGGE